MNGEIIMPILINASYIILAKLIGQFIDPLDAKLHYMFYRVTGLCYLHIKYVFQ